MPSEANAKPNAAREWAEIRTDAEAVLYRLVADGYRLKVGEDGTLKLGRYDGERQSLSSGLKESIRKHQDELKTLVMERTSEEDAEVWRGITEGIVAIYPVGVGCDLDPAADVFIKAHQALDRGDRSGWWYCLHVGCKMAVRICEVAAQRIPEFAQDTMI